MTSPPRRPQAVGAASGLPVPSRLPDIGTAVVDADGYEGVVALYEFYDPDQVWFPVEFPVRANVRTRRCRLAKHANRRGYVRLAEPAVVTPLDRARKPARDPSAHDVAGHAAAS